MGDILFRGGLYISFNSIHMIHTESTLQFIYYIFNSIHKIHTESTLQFIYYIQLTKFYFENKLSLYEGKKTKKKMV